MLNPQVLVIKKDTCYNYIISLWYLVFSNVPQKLFHCSSKNHAEYSRNTKVPQHEDIVLRLWRRLPEVHLVMGPIQQGIQLVMGDVCGHPKPQRCPKMCKDVQRCAKMKMWMFIDWVTVHTCSQMASSAFFTSQGWVESSTYYPWWMKAHILNEDYRL